MERFGKRAEQPNLKTEAGSLENFKSKDDKDGSELAKSEEGVTVRLSSGADLTFSSADLDTFTFKQGRGEDTESSYDDRGTYEGTVDGKKLTIHEDSSGFQAELDGTELAPDVSGRLFTIVHTVAQRRRSAEVDQH